MKHLVLVLLTLLALPTTALAQNPEPVSGWQQIMTAIAPPARYDHVLIAASDLNRLVLFGGRDGTEFSDTWIFDLETQTWREVISEPTPSPRFGMGAAYDAERQRVLVFGGQGDRLFNDTWAFDLASESWSLLPVTGAIPGIRYGTSAVIDSDADQLIISHGFAAGRYDDTFALDLATNTWADVSPEDRPFKRCLHDAAFDPLTRQMLLFGGCSSPTGPCPQGDFWSFQAGQWTEIAPTGDKPAPRLNPALIVDNQSRVWLIGGNTDSGYSDDLWQFDLTLGAWTALKSDTAPAPRASHDALWHNGQIILFGGQGSNGALSDLWIYTPVGFKN